MDSSDFSYEFVYDIYIYIFIYLLQVADICMIVHLLYQTPIFVILFIYSILGKRFLLSTVLEVFSTDTEMLFSVAGFQTSTVKEKKKRNRKGLQILRYIYTCWIWNLVL